MFLFSSYSLSMVALSRSAMRRDISSLSSWLRSRELEQRIRAYTELEIQKIINP